MAKKPSSKGASRAAKRQRQQRVTVALAAGVATTIVAVIAVSAVRASNLPGEKFRSQGNVHLLSIATNRTVYNTDPPTSGPHMPNIAGWGAYDEVVEDEYLIHNMEDGGVILWYPLGTPEENEAHISALQGVARGFSRTVIAPRADLGSAYVLTAWTRMQRFDAIDEDGMRAFLRAYEGLDHHPR